MYDIATKYNEPIEAAHAHITDDRTYMTMMCCFCPAQIGPPIS